MELYFVVVVFLFELDLFHCTKTDSCGIICQRRNGVFCGKVFTVLNKIWVSYGCGYDCG